MNGWVNEWVKDRWTWIDFPLIFLEIGNRGGLFSQGRKKEKTERNQ